MFYEPHIDRYDLSCPRLPAAFDGLSLLHLSDLHITRWTHRLALWESALEPLHPDLLVVTGDLGHRSWLWKKSLGPVTRLLHAVRPTLGTYFILGNHDSTKLAPALSRLNGFTYLANETVFLAPPAKKLEAGNQWRGERERRKEKKLEMQNMKQEMVGAKARLSRIENQKSKTTPPPSIPPSAPLSFPPSSLSPPPYYSSSSPRVALIGIHQHRRIDTDIPTAMREVAPDDFKLMLLHYPDLIHQAVAAGVDVCLAGHTHGGQICWPDGRPIIRHDVLSQEMCTGVHRIGSTWMVVNRGLGVAGIRVRLFCPPQAILLTLHTAPPFPTETH